MQRWCIIRFSISEAEILEHPPALFLYSAAGIVIFLLFESLGVPDEYIMTICLSFPRRLFSTAVSTRSRLFSTAVERPQDVLHDGLSLFFNILIRNSQVEDFTNANRIEAPLMNQVEDLYRKTFAGMLLRCVVPADVVKCQPVDLRI